MNVAFPPFYGYCLKKSAAEVMAIDLTMATNEADELSVCSEEMNSVAFTSRVCRKKTVFKDEWKKKIEEKRNEKNVSKENFIIENACDCKEWKLPGSINGEQFIIQNCTNSTILILDFTNTVIVDECNYCTIILGPIKRSIFFRDCADCKIIVACEQFRLRDCKNLKISLFCATRPIIESSKGIIFTCFQLYYDNIQEHLKECNLNPWNNLWYKIHDYTPANKNDYPNWNFGDDNLIEIASLPPEIEPLNVSISKNNCAVPSTAGVIHRVYNLHENCFVVFCDAFSAKSFLKSVNSVEANVALIKSRQVEMTRQHAESLFLTSLLVNAVQHSPVIGLHMYGKHAIQICTQVISKTAETTMYYVSPTSNMASHQVNTFFSIADLQMEFSN